MIGQQRSSLTSDTADAHASSSTDRMAAMLSRPARSALTADGAPPDRDTEAAPELALGPADSGRGPARAALGAGIAHPGCETSEESIRTGRGF